MRPVEEFKEKPAAEVAEALRRAPAGTCGTPACSSGGSTSSWPSWPASSRRCTPACAAIAEAWGTAGAGRGARRGLADAAEDLGRLRGDGGRGRGRPGRHRARRLRLERRRRLPHPRRGARRPTSAGNVVRRRAEADGASRACCCSDTDRLVVVPQSGRLVAALGVRDLIIVDTPDALLVCPRDRAQDVKKLVDELKERGEDGRYVSSGGRVPARPVGRSAPASGSGSGPARTSRAPRLVADLLDRARRGDRGEPDVVVQRAAAEQVHRVDVDVDRHRVDAAARRCRTPRWPPAARPRPGSGRGFAVPAELHPAPEPAVQAEQHPVAGGVEHQRAGGDVAGPVLPGVIADRAGGEQAQGPVPGGWRRAGLVGCQPSSRAIASACSASYASGSIVWAVGPDHGVGHPATVRACAPYPGRGDPATRGIRGRRQRGQRPVAGPVRGAARRARRPAGLLDRARRGAGGAVPGPAAGADDGGWVAQHVPADAGVENGRTEDGEALAHHDGWVYVFGSHFGSKAGPLRPRRAFVARFREDDAAPGYAAGARGPQPVPAAPGGQRRPRRRRRSPCCRRGSGYGTGSSSRPWPGAPPGRRRWVSRLAEDDLPVNVEAAAFTPAGTVLLGLRFPVTDRGEPILVEVAGCGRDVRPAGGWPRVVGAYALTGVTRPGALTGFRALSARRTTAAYDGGDRLDRRARQGLGTARRPSDGGEVTSRHVRFRLGGRAERGRYRPVSWSPTWRRCTTSREWPSWTACRYYVTDEDHRVALWIGSSAARRCGMRPPGRHLRGEGPRTLVVPPGRRVLPGSRHTAGRPASRTRRRRVSGIASMPNRSAGRRGFSVQA